jgi:DEAD/DEAH box helicase domain-containing protein
VLIAQEDALDQHFMRDPADFFKRGVEAAVLNPFNRLIVRRHLACAAAEQPLIAEDQLLAGQIFQVVQEMARDGELLLGADGKTWHAVRKYPHREVDLRGSGRAFAIHRTDNDQLLGEIDGIRALKECYPGAVYLQRGRTWLVTALDLEGHRVQVTQSRVNYFTRPIGHKQTEILATLETKIVFNTRLSLGNLRVTDTITGFERRLVSSQKLIATESLDLPPMVFETEGLWLEIPKPLQERLERSGIHFMGGIHALEHAAIGILPLLVLCDRNDLGGIAQPSHPQLRGAAVFIYDGYPGGVGLVRQAFSRFAELLSNTLRTISQCPCETGCPSCVHSPKCGSGNRPIDKAAARLLLEGLFDYQPENKVVIEAVIPKGSDSADGLLKQNKPRLPPGGYGVFDVETRLSAEEVGGWHRADRMGVSIAVFYDGRTDTFISFREHEMPQFIARLRKLKLVVGFNNKRFDNQVLSAYCGHDLHDLPTLDILEEVQKQLGYRLSLDHLAEQTLGIKKSANGLMALKWYREGQFDKIIDYCRQDVEITRDLYLFGLRNGYLLFQNKAGIKVRCPVRF